MTAKKSLLTFTAAVFLIFGISAKDEPDDILHEDDDEIDIPAPPGTEGKTVIPIQKQDKKPSEPVKNKQDKPHKPPICWDASKWTVVKGAWKVEPSPHMPGKLYAHYGKGGGVSLLDGHREDFVVEVRVKLLSEYGAGVYLRYQDEKNYYRLRVDTRKPGILFHKMVNGVNTNLVCDEKTAILTGVWYTLKVVAKGKILRVFLNGVQIGKKVVDNSFSEGKIGLTAYTDCHFHTMTVKTK